ncbi:Disease resistance protein RGA2 [Spatholobus suberectus]|nr:Disease resistance protein RGA2 [Spatholobus suberectus]
MGRFKTLPESICKLWNLQILKLDGCHYLQKLPSSLIRSKALQELSLKDCHRLSSLLPQIGKLTSLRILSMYFVGKERGFHLAEMGPLKLKGDLEIKHLERVKSVKDAKEANMSSKQLNNLTLSWDRNDGEWELQENVEEILEVLQPDTQQLQSLSVEGYKGAHFPQWMSSSPSLNDLSLKNLPNLIRLSREDGENMFPHLSKLTIVGCHKLLNVSAGFQCLTRLEELLIFRCREVEVEGLHEALQRMTSLKELALYDLPKLESSPDCFGNLPLLQSLDIHNLPKLESLPDCFGNLPLLRELHIENCSMLRCLPTSLSLSSSLQYLMIVDCHPELEKRCEKETGEDWPKIAHIPHIYISKRK